VCAPTRRWPNRADASSCLPRFLRHRLSRGHRPAKVPMFPTRSGVRHALLPGASTHSRSVTPSFDIALIPPLAGCEHRNVMPNPLRAATSRLGACRGSGIAHRILPANRGIFEGTAPLFPYSGLDFSWPGGITALKTPLKTLWSAWTYARNRQYSAVCDRMMGTCRLAPVANGPHSLRLIRGAIARTRFAPTSPVRQLGCPGQEVLPHVSVQR